MRDLSEVLEVVHFNVPADRRDAFLAKRPAAMAALRDAFPGLLEARLGERDDGTWVDVVRWRSRADAETAAAECSGVPAFHDWMSLIGEVLELSHAEIRHEVGA